MYGVFAQWYAAARSSKRRDDGADGDSGELVAIHRKVHLFDIDIPGKIKFKVGSFRGICMLEEN